MQKLHLFLIVTVLSCDVDEAVNAFKSKQIRDPILSYAKNPYEIVDLAYQQKVQDNLKDSKSVCAIKYDDDEKQIYQLKQFNSKEEAEENQFIVTHQGKCGACSTLQDLVVYLKTDLTRLVRQCGLMYGLSEIFRYMCLSLVVQYFKYKNHVSGFVLGLFTIEDFVKNGQLNQCLQCDEDISGPIFKYESGRTRRNSGIKSEIDRPSDQIYDITHCYY